MKKNLIIGFLTIVSLLSLTYGYFQKERADEQEKIANEAMTKAEQNQREAEMQSQLAEKMAQRAKEQQLIAEKVLSESKAKR